jgi:hypothetical protein
LEKLGREEDADEQNESDVFLVYPWYYCLCTDRIRVILSRMSESPQLVRQWKILQILEASRNGCTVQELIAETEVSDKTVRRDLKVLQNVFDITERTLAGGIKRWQMKPLSEQLGFNYTELLSIHMSQQFLKPLGMVHHKGSLYLIAWSARREEVRNFKVDRMESVAMQNLQYQVPIEFDLQEWLSKSFGANRKKQVEDHAEKSGLRNVVIILRVMCCSKRQIWCRANFQVDEIKWTASVTRRVTTTLVCPVHGTDAVLQFTVDEDHGADAFQLRKGSANDERNTKTSADCALAGRTQQNTESGSACRFGDGVPARPTDQRSKRKCSSPEVDQLKHKDGCPHSQLGQHACHAARHGCSADRRPLLQFGAFPRFSQPRSAKCPDGCTGNCSDGRTDEWKRQCQQHGAGNAADD